MSDQRFPLLDHKEFERDEKVLLLTVLQELRELRFEVDKIRELVLEIPVDFF